MGLTLVILAAGMGQRFGGLKQIEPVGPRGELIVDYSLYDALKAGFTDTAIVLRQEMEAAFQDSIGHRLGQQLPVRYVYQDVSDLPAGRQPKSVREKPWGTGHAVWVCRNHVSTPFAVVNADDYYGPQSYQILARMMRGENGGSLQQSPSTSTPNEYVTIAFQLANTLSEFGDVSRGVCDVDEEGWLTQIVECRNLVKSGAGARYPVSSTEWRQFHGHEMVSMNFWGFTPEIFARLESLLLTFLEANGDRLDAEFYLPTAIDRLIATRQARVKVARTPEKWFGITFSPDLAQVKSHIRERIVMGVYPEKLWSN